MSPDSFIELMAAVLALASAALSVYAIRVANRLEERREIRNKDEQAARLMSKYRDPLLYAAFDLQSRLYNIVRLDFLSKYYVNGTPSERQYAVSSTLHVVGQYLAWVELLRREVQFLDLRDVKRDRELSGKLEAVARAFFDDKIDPRFRIFRAEQRAIGEVMIQPVPERDGRGYECMGYASFVSKERDPEFNAWFTQLRNDIEVLAADRSKDGERLVELQHALVDLIDFLDPEHRRFPELVRTKTAAEPQEPSQV